MREAAQLYEGPTQPSDCRRSRFHPDRDSAPNSVVPRLDRGWSSPQRRCGSDCATIGGRARSSMAEQVILSRAGLAVHFPAWHPVRNSFSQSLYLSAGGARVLPQ